MSEHENAYLACCHWFLCLFVSLFRVVVLLSSLLVLALLSFNCLLSQSNVQDYGGLFFLINVSLCIC